MCGQYPGAVPAGATVSVYCEDNPPPSRYVIVQFPINDIMTVCEIQVHVRGMSKIFTARGIVYVVSGKKVPCTLVFLQLFEMLTDF